MSEEPKPKGGLKGWLKKVFSRKAKVVVPESVLKDPAVKKAVLKQWAKGRRKKFFHLALASTALSTVLQFCPFLVSRPFDEHMEKNGSPHTSLQDHFHAQDTHVYHRWNPLVPFHLAGRMGVLGWEEAGREDGGLLSKTGSASLGYILGLGQGVMELIPFMSSPLDAYSFTGSGPVEERTVFIRPPARLSAQEFTAKFGHAGLENFKFKSDPQQLAQVFYDYVMLHEARHGDQNKSMSGTANESDADLYAWKVLRARGVDESVLSEAAEIITHARVMQAVIGGGTDHTTSFSLQRGFQTAAHAHNDAAIFWQFHGMLLEAHELNEHVFDPATPKANRYIYLAIGMMASGALDHNPVMQKAARQFISSASYFSRLGEGSLVNSSFPLKALDFSYLNQEYKPVPDKLAPPAPPPGPGR